MLDIVVGIILLIAAIFLTVAILMQEGKGNISGAIGGGSGDTFFGKNGGAGKSRLLSKVTTVVAVLFTAVVLLLYILQPNNNKIDESQKNPVDPDATTSEDVADDAE